MATVILKGKALSHVGRSKSHVDPGRRPKPKHNLRAPQGVRIKRAKVSASKPRPTSIRRPLANTTSKEQVSGPLPLRCCPAVPSEPTLQCAQCQIMLLTRFTPSQSTGFEFRHQPFDLLAASPLPNVNLSDFRHAHSASKTRPVRQVGWSEGYIGFIPAIAFYLTPPNRHRCYARHAHRIRKSALAATMAPTNPN